MDANKKWDEAESIQLIRSMMETTRSKMYNHRFLYFMWGYFTLACAAAHYILGYVLDFGQPYLIWLCMPLAAIAHMVYLSKERKTETVKTYADRVMSGIWGGMSIAIVAVLIGSPKVGWEVVYPVFMLLYGVAAYASGMTLRYKYLIWGGIISMGCGLFAFYQPFQFQLLLLQGAIIASFILPAHFMTYKSN